MSRYATRLPGHNRLTRRGFIIGTGFAGAGLTLGLPLSRFADAADESAAVSELPFPTDPMLWFEISPDDSVTIRTPKVEMGQGVHTSIAQVAADELGARWDQVVVVQGTSSVGPKDDEGTVGSFSTEKTFEPVRRAAAELRQVLVEEAARRLDTTPASLVVNEGRVASDIGATMTFGEIVAGVDNWREPVTKPTLIDASAFRFIGKPMPRLDYAAKLRGEPVYGYDLRVDNMLYGAVARSPYFEAKLTRADPGKAEDMPGVVKVVIDEDAGFAGVAARTRRQAAQAVAALDVEWDEGRRWSSDDIDALLAVDEHDGALIQNEGHALAATAGDDAYAAEYATPLGSNAQLEPLAALAEVTDSRITVRISTQNAQLARRDIAETLKVDAGIIEVIPAYVGGGFGRKDDNSAVLEAVRLSQGAGRPVHVGWTREDEMRNGRFRPPTRHRLAAKTGAGRIEAISHSMTSGIILAPEILMHELPIDFGTILEGSWQYGKIANRRFNSKSIRLPIPTGPWRGLASMPNCFAVESFIDELAHREGMDPLDFRLAHLGDSTIEKRRRRVLEMLAERVDYGSGVAQGRARGIACAGDTRSVVALCLEISLDDNGAVVVHKATEVLDAGLIVNPDGAEAQVIGGITMGLSAVLQEKIEIVDGMVRQQNFNQYPLLTMERVPDFEVVFVDSDLPPKGLGEPPLFPVAAAMGNAIFNLTGKRVREFPFTPDTIRSA